LVGCIARRLGQPTNGRLYRLEQPTNGRLYPG